MQTPHGRRKPLCRSAQNGLSIAMIIAGPNFLVHALHRECRESRIVESSIYGSMRTSELDPRGYSTRRIPPAFPVDRIP